MTDSTAPTNNDNNDKKRATTMTDKIKEGERNTYLTAYAGELKLNGIHGDELLDLLQQRNVDRCDPPLAYVYVTEIADSVKGYWRDIAHDEDVRSIGDSLGVRAQKLAMLEAGGVPAALVVADKRVEFGLAGGMGSEDFKRVVEGEPMVGRITGRRGGKLERVPDDATESEPEVVEGWRSARLFSCSELIEMRDVSDDFLEHTARERYTGPRTFRVERGLVAPDRTNDALDAARYAHSARPIGVLYVGPAGHVYYLPDIQHAFEMLAKVHTDVELDVDFVEQMVLMAICKSAPIRLIALDYSKRERDRSKLSWPESWPERLTAQRDDYAPTAETLERAGQTMLRALSFSAQRSSRIFNDAAKRCGETETALVHALTMASSLADLAANLANIATVPEGSATDADVVATFRAELVPALAALAEDIAPKPVSKIIH